MSEWWGEGAVEWRSGPWSVEVRDDEFADIAFDGLVVLRSARAVVRDRNWDTPPLIVDRVDASDLAVTLHVRCEAFGADLRGIVRAEVRADRLVVLTDLESQTDFDTNRTGLVVLHPPALAGTALRITHATGAVEQTAFPDRISPHQPAFDITALSWADPAGLDVDVRFAGDAFEMEDQRNWTDASYKTYSRPLALPFPYRLAAGERVVQSVEVRVSGAVAADDDDAPARIRLEPGVPLPHIAVSASTAPDPAPAIEPVGSATLVELDLATRNWRAALERAGARPTRPEAPGAAPAASGGGVGTARPLDVRFVLADADPSALGEGVRALRGHDLARVTAFWPTGPARHVSDARAIALLRDAMTDAGVQAPVVGGARSHFTELNRENHRLPAGLDGVVFSVTPLFHSPGTHQLIESLPMQRLVATQAVDIAGGVPVHVGPVSLRPHFNDVATTPPPMPEHDDLRDGYGSALIDSADARISAPELAAWTVASAAALAVPGVATIAYFEEWGARGLADDTGTPRPVHAAATALASLAGLPGLRGDSPDGLVWAIGARGEAGDTVLVANLGGQRRTVTVDTPAGSLTTHIDGGSFVRLAVTPTALNHGGS